jgi:hypothetical protein
VATIEKTETETETQTYMATVRAARPTTLVEFTSPPPKPLASEADYNTPTLPFE